MLSIITEPLAYTINTIHTIFNTVTHTHTQYQGWCGEGGVRVGGVYAGVWCSLRAIRHLTDNTVITHFRCHAAESYYQLPPAHELHIEAATQWYFLPLPPSFLPSLPSSSFISTQVTLPLACH